GDWLSRATAGRAATAAWARSKRSRTRRPQALPQRPPAGNGLPAPLPELSRGLRGDARSASLSHLRHDRSGETKCKRGQQLLPSRSPATLSRCRLTLAAGGSNPPLATQRALTRRRQPGTQPGSSPERYPPAGRADRPPPSSAAACTPVDPCPPESSDP
ncbi:MAG: hypothetical protein RL033_2993, partial [Pseudomonadota bacterium]